MRIADFGARHSECPVSARSVRDLPKMVKLSRLQQMVENVPVQQTLIDLATNARFSMFLIGVIQRGLERSLVSVVFEELKNEGGRKQRLKLQEQTKMALSFVGHGDEYYETIDKINSVLRKHIEPFDQNRPKVDAYQFRSSYLSFLEDFWSNEEALIALEDLTRALQKICIYYEAVPKMVRDDLAARAWGLDQERKEEFLKRTKADIVFKSSLPGSDVNDAVEALKTLVKQKEALRSAISVVQNELPEGMPTRNRPGKAWAVIHAAVEVSASGRKINVPKSIDGSGPFYKLLDELFELFEIKESVPGAFRGWRKHMDGNYENLDLMPI